MAYYSISQPIEYIINGSVDVAQSFKLFKNSDLINPIYSGKVQPYPGTGKSVIILNDIIESFLNFDDISLDLDDFSMSSGDTVLSKVLPNMSALFTLDKSDGVVSFVVDNVYTKIGLQGNIATRQLIPSIDVQEIDSNTELYLIYRTPSVGGTIQRSITMTMSDSTTRLLTFTAPENSFVCITFAPSEYTLTGITGFTLSRIGSSTIDLRYKLVSKCYSYILYWVNHLGGIDFLYGNPSSKMNTESQFVDFKKNYRSFNGTTMIGNQGTFGVNRSLITSTDKYVFQTELLTPNAHIQIEYLFTSPKIWITSDSTTFYSLICSDTQFEQKKFRVDKLVNRTINLEKSINNRRR